MALDAEEFDFEGLGSRLTQTVIDSFNQAVKGVKFSSIGTGLETALKGVDLGKVMSDPLSKGIKKLTDDAKVGQAIGVVKKKLEDGFNKINFKVGDIVLPELPEQVVKVAADTSNFKLPKSEKLEVPVNYLYSKFELPKTTKLTVPVDYKYEKLILPKVEALKVNVEYIYQKFTQPKPKEVPITLVPDTTKIDSVKPTVDTAPFEKVGDLVREFVNLTQEANKRTKISSELYTKIVGIAEKLVATKRMEKGAVDEIINTLQQKMDVPPAEVGAKVTTVDTSAIDDAISKYKPIELEVKINATTGAAPTIETPEVASPKYDIGGLTEASKLSKDILETLTKHPEKLGLSKKQAAFLVEALNNNLKHLENLNKEGDSFEVKLKKMLVKSGEISAEGYRYSRVNTEINRILGGTNKIQAGLNEQRREGIKLALSGKQGSEEALLILQSQLEVFEEQAQALGHEGRLAEYVAKQLGNGVPHTKIIQSQTYKTLANLQAQQKLSRNLTAAQLDYNNAIKQAKADIRIKNQTIQLRLTEQETSELAYQAYQQNLSLRAMGMLTEEQKKQIKANGGLTDEQVKQIKLENHKLRQLREERELVEHVANYQREVNEELEKYSMGWKKTKATMSAIIKDPAFAKGVFIAGAIKSVEQLNHSMHEFMDIGMTAGEGVSATFRTLSVSSLMGLNKSKDVLTSMVQQTGNMNTLNQEQLDSVGKIAASYGLAGDEAFNLTMAVSRMPGETKDTAANFDKTVASVAKMKGVMPSQVMKEMAKNTGTMAMFSKGGAEGFAKAAATAKKMGIEVSSMAKSAEGLLDFENSINKQMEASILLGREINLDKARELALQGDLEGATSEILRNVGGAAAFDKMNVLQKKALAEATGLSVEELSKAAKAQQDGTAAAEDQSNTLEDIAGTTMKITGGLLGGFGKIAPMLMSITSLMSIMNSGGALGGMVTKVYQFGKGLLVGVFQAGLLLAKMVAIGAASLFGKGEQAKNLLLGGKGVGESVKGIFSKKPGGAITPTAPETPKPSAPAASGKAGPTDQASKVGKLKTGDMLKGAAALLIVAAALYVAAKAFQEFASVKWEDVGKGLTGLAGLALVAVLLGKVQGQMIKGAIAVAILGAALIPMAFAFQMIAGIKPEDLVTFGVALVGFSLAAAGLGFLAGNIIMGAVAIGILGVALIPMAFAFQMIAGIKPEDLVTFGIALVGFSLAAAGLGFLAANIIIGAIAIGILGVALIPMAAAFKMVEGLDPDALITFGIALVSFAGAAAGLAFIAPLVVIGAEAIAILGLAMLPFAAAMALAAPATEIMAKVLRDLSGDATAKNLKTLSSSLFGLAKALGAVGFAGLMALPALGVISGLSSLGALGGGAAPATPAPAATPKAEAKAVAPTPTAAPAAIAAAPAPTPAPAPTTSTPSKQESSSEMKALVDKLDALIAVMKSGATITMDGAKVAEVVQRNIRTVKYAD